MTLKANSAEMTERFDALYRLGEAHEIREMERTLCGCDYGSTSWAIKDEADELIGLMKLSPTSHLLELGSGSGWPALYMAKKSGCRVTMTDVSREGLRVAQERAAQDKLIDKCRFSLASGADLPFDACAFDAISHSDVLCCLEEKIEMLAECRRVIKDNGRMAFSVIYIRPDVGPDAVKQVVAAGPSLVEAPAPYPQMLENTGWRIESRREITSQLETTVSNFIGEYERRREALLPVMGEEGFEADLNKFRAKHYVIVQGLLKRDIYLVTPK